jgi:lactoylglutathione lyase
VSSPADKDVSVSVKAFDHVGIRVTNAKDALAFYAKFGFAIDPDYSNDQVAEIVSPDGVRLNLIFNGEATPKRNNLLLDEPKKWPGYTHAAFIVTNLQEVLDLAARERIVITEGPVDWGRRLTCFLRDPDGNVLEFNELKDDPAMSAYRER